MDTIFLLEDDATLGRGIVFCKFTILAVIQNNMPCFVKDENSLPYIKRIAEYLLDDQKLMCVMLL